MVHADTFHRIVHQSFANSHGLLDSFSITKKTSQNSHKFALTLGPANYGYWKAMIHPFLLTLLHLQMPLLSQIICNDAHVHMLTISTISEASFHHVNSVAARDLWLSLQQTHEPHSSSREYTLS